MLVNKDNVFFVVDKVEFEEILYFGAVDLFGMGPLKSIEGFNEWQFCVFDASVNSSFESGLNFNFKQG